MSRILAVSGARIRDSSYNLMIRRQEETLTPYMQYRLSKYKRYCSDALIVELLADCIDSM